MIKFKKLSELPLRKIAYKYKVLLGITLFLMVAVFSFGTIFIKSYIARNRDLRQAEIDKDAENMMASIENSLMMLHKYYLTSEDNDEVRFAVENNLDYTKVSKITRASDTLDGGNIVTDYVSSFTLVNFKDGTVLGTKGKYELSDVYNTDIVTTLYDDYKETYTKNTWVYIDGSEPGRNTRQYRTTVPLYGLDLVLFVPYSEVHPYALIIVNVDMNQLAGDIKKQLGKDQNAALYNSNGDLVFSIGKGFPEKIKENQKSGKIDNSYVSFSESEIAGLTLCLRGSFDGMELFANAYYLIAFLLIVVLMLMLAIVLFNSIYKPIQTAIGEIEKSNGEKLLPGEDELSYLTNSVKKLDNDNFTLKSHTKTFFATRLYRNELTSFEIDQYMTRLSLLDKVPPRYRILTFVLESIDEDQISSEEDKRICNEIIEELSKSTPRNELLPQIYYARTIVTFIGLHESDDGKDIIEKNYNFLTQHVYGRYGMNIGVGVSDIFEDIYDINKAYLESVQALHHGKIDIGSYLCYYRPEAGMAQMSFDEEKEGELRRALMRGDKEGAYAIIDDFFRQLIDRNVSRENTVPLILRLVNGIVLLTQTQGIGTEVYREDLREIYPAIFEYTDLNRARKYIKYNIIDPIIYHQNSVMDSQSANIMAAIEQLVEEREGNVTLNECSDILSYHTSYIWRILKEEKNMTFTEYVEDYKIRLAKKYLSETDITVGAIAEKLNYTNAQNFIRFFNKMVGMTPGKYRQANRDLLQA